MLAYVYDKALHDKLNTEHQNYWDIYLEEICGLLGVGAKTLGLADLAGINSMPNMRVLIIGQQSGAVLDKKTREILADWVQAGGILIGFAVPKLEAVFGIQAGGLLKQQQDDYTISAHFDLRPHPLTHEIHPMMFLEQRLLILSDVQKVTAAASAAGAAELAHLYDSAGNDLQASAVTWHAYGKGFAAYFAFDAAKTVWLLHQGKPIPLVVKQNRRYPRAFDLCLLGNNSRKIPYADEIVFLLQNMIAQAPVPFVYQIPPQDSQVADALFYWGGDEYTGPTELSLGASDWLKSKGLPYHINLQAENHPMTSEEFQHILDNGHEISEYFHMLDEDGGAAHEALYQRQSDEFFQRFGYRPITSVNCVLRWNGWADSARWMEKAGSKADNSFSGHPITLNHPLANMPYFGMGYGTAYPFNFYDDAEHHNRKIDLLEQPIVCYEIGHRGSLLDHETDVCQEVHLPVETALKYHWVMNLFYHPTYVAKYPLCRKAIEEILATITRHQARVVHMGNDALYAWWQARRQAVISDMQLTDNSIRFNTQCDYSDGIVVKLLLKRVLSTIKGDGRYPMTYEIRKEFTGSWLYLVIEPGKHTIEICYQ